MLGELGSGLAAAAPPRVIGLPSSRGLQAAHTGEKEKIPAVWLPGSTRKKQPHGANLSRLGTPIPCSALDPRYSPAALPTSVPIPGVNHCSASKGYCGNKHVRNREVLGYHGDEATEVLRADGLCTGKTARGWQHPGSHCAPRDGALQVAAGIIPQQRVAPA